MSISGSIEERVISIIADQLDLSEDEIKLSDYIIDDLKADSLAIVELSMAFEEEFNIELPEEEAERIVTVRDILDYVTAHTHEDE